MARRADGSYIDDDDAYGVPDARWRGVEPGPPQPTEYERGWNDGLEQACMILSTDEALSSVSHKAIKIALNALKRRAGLSGGTDGT